MNQPPDENPSNPSESPFMGPAVPPRPSAADERDDLAEPLAPFFGGAGKSDEDDAGDEIPWLVSREDAERDPAPPPLLEEQDYLGGVPEVEIDVESDLVPFEALEPDADTAPEPRVTPEAGAASLDVDDWEAALAGLPQSEPVQPQPAPGRGEPDQPAPGRELHVEQAGGFREAGAAIAQDVADRLERIAHSLRVRGPNELLSGAGDPLEILIIGYVLGASQAQAGSAGEQGPTL